MAPLLETRDLSVTFGIMRANDAVNINVHEGAFVGLIGPNGAGKTTFIDAVTGYVPSRGAVSFDGKDIHTLPAHKRARLGLVRTFQSLELFEDLSVEDNLLASAQAAKWYTPFLDMAHIHLVDRDIKTRISWALDVVGLGHVADRVPTDLSHGQRKLVGVARGLAAHPKLVLLDEPAAGLDTAESQVLGTHLRGLLNEGISVFMIDHDMGLVLSVCDYLYVLDFGKIIGEGTPAQIRANPAVISAYLGESARDGEEAPAESIPGGPTE